jgi:hypothetical protein
VKKQVTIVYTTAVTYMITSPSDLAEEQVKDKCLEAIMAEANWLADDVAVLERVEEAQLDGQEKFTIVDVE